MSKKPTARNTKKAPAQAEGFEPTKMALAVSSAAVTSLLLLALLANM